MTETMNEATYKPHLPQLLHSFPFSVTKQKHLHTFRYRGTGRKQAERCRGMSLHSNTSIIQQKHFATDILSFFNTGFNIWDERIIVKTFLGELWGKNKDLTGLLWIHYLSGADEKHSEWEYLLTQQLWEKDLRNRRGKRTKVALTFWFSSISLRISEVTTVFVKDLREEREMWAFTLKMIH